MAQSVAESGGTDMPEDSPLSRDDLFELLGNDRRRQALEIVMGREDGVDIGELVEEVASMEYDKPTEALTRPERKAVYTAVVQRHLPKLEQQGLVFHDQDRGEVSPSEALVDLNIYFEITREGQRPFSIYYFGLAVAGACVMALSLVDVGPVSVLSPIQWLSLFLGGLGIMSLTHLYEMRRMSVRPVPTPFGSDYGQQPQLARLATAIATVTGGVTAGGLMWVVLHDIMFFSPVITLGYGLESMDLALALHLGHSVVFAVLFVVIVSRTNLRKVSISTGECAALGICYGVVLWILVMGTFVPALTDAALATYTTVAGYDVLYLPLDGLAAHVIYGGILGATVAVTRKQLLVHA